MSNNTLNSTLSKLRYHGLITDEQYKNFKKSNMVKSEEDVRLLKSIFDKCLKEWNYERDRANRSGKIDFSSYD